MMTTSRTALATTALLVAAGSVAFGTTSDAAGPVYAGPTPGVPCAAGALPESTQGRVPLSEVTSGRAAKGYRCNAVQVSRHGDSGGWHVWHYRDKAGRTCAYYDSTVLLGRDPGSIVKRGPGTVVLDMTDARKPVQTTVLATPGMDQPHESLRLNARRGLLAAVSGTPITAPGILDVYDVSKDCRHPELLSSTPTGLLGHESGFSPDGRTFWANSWMGNLATLQAIDISDPRLPKLLLVSTEWVLHGMSLSADGNTLYGADQGAHPGLRTLDVSEVQARKPNPRLREISFLNWPQITTPQVAEPVTITGRPYVVEVDEFAKEGRVGAARVIDISDIRHPQVVSNLRLEVHEPAEQTASQDDPGTSGFQSYSAHYCAVPRRTEPHLVACSFILSGLRVFDIRNPRNPVEVAYFNPPVTGTLDALNPVTRVGSFAMSGPAFDIERGQVWYSDGNTGFYAVQLLGAARAALDGTSPVVEGVAGRR